MKNAEIERKRQSGIVAKDDKKPSKNELFKKAYEDARKSCENSWFLHVGEVSFDSRRLSILLDGIVSLQRKIKRLEDKNSEDEEVKK